MSLLERYYDLKEGKIYIDGVDYMTYSKQEVRQNIGIILQDPAIFEGTIKSNITLGEDVPDEEVEKSFLKLVEINLFVAIHKVFILQLLIWEKTYLLEKNN